jgi:acetolactate synthase-1/2/3 large subunit
MARTTVADVLLDGLARAGASRVFAAPGAPVALVVAAHRRELDVVAAPDTASAGLLAAVSGEVGDGPGAAVADLDDVAGIVRGLAHAHRDRAPLIVLTGGGAGTGLLAPAVKASIVVESASAGHWIAHAAHLATTDPRGPVHLAVGPDAVDQSALAVAASCRRAPLPPATPECLDALAGAIDGATRPLLVTGLECGPDDAKWIRAFAEALPAPVLATPKGKGALADPHPLALGPLGAGHAALARADLVLLVGVDAGELPPGVLPAGTRVARIGRAGWQGGAFVAEALGELALVIEELAPRVRARPAADWDVAELDRIKRAAGREAAATPAGRLVALAREATPVGTLATADVPVLAAWQAVGPREALSPLGMAAPGYAVLAAVAAGLARLDRHIVAFTRPRGLAAAETALTLAVARRLWVIVVVLGALEEDVRARLERSGLLALVAGDEAGFAEELSRALLARRPSLVALRPGA